MGEVKVLEILAGELIRSNSDISLFITVMTEAGYQRASNLMGNKWPVSFLTLDYPSAIRRFLRVMKPSAVVFIETEIWPNMVIEFGKRNIPVFLANGRLSEKSSQRYRWFKSGLKKVFVLYKKLMVQSLKDKERYMAIGAKADQVEVIKSLKFDAPIVGMDQKKQDQLKNMLPFDKGDKIIIAGSTRNGENEIILRSFEKIAVEIPGAKLILVPRHLDRIDEICIKVGSLGLTFARFSQLPFGEKCKVLVVDKMGILNDLYHISDIAFVGGTLVELGGHNILEPVWAGIPVLFGPSIFNVEDSAAYIIENKFGAIVRDETELLEKIKSCLSGQGKYRKKGSDSDDISYSRLTAKIIFDEISLHGKNLA